EDARVDSRMFEARPGVRTMMNADVLGLFTKPVGVHEDGTDRYWRDAPLNTQASIACYLAACEFKNWRDWLHPLVARAFTDERLLDLAATVPNLGGASETYNISFKFLAILREYGFFLMPEDKENQDED